uniref:Uncharacterized protein n=1 Tax=Knipowitschia caucasica TaxID=637954 RepID=A0AAV2J4J1_KNICA
MHLSPVGTVVGQLEGPQSPTPITFSVLEDDGQNLFLLSPLSGEFLLSRGLDFETQSLFILTVGAQMRLDSVTSIRVYFNVLDVNDNPPLFSRDVVSLSLQENMWTGACFLTLNVSDKDAGDVIVMVQLDREITSNYAFILKALDLGNPSMESTATLNITVLDVNDCTPVFLPDVVTEHVTENENATQLSLEIRAQDDDIGLNSELTYFIQTDNKDLFSISPNGELHISNSLDREKESSYKVVITAVDSGMVVCVALANDADADMNAELRYSLYQPSTDAFSIDAHSGAVFISAPLTSTEEITLHVYVEDAGESPKFEMTTVTILFRNTSDFPVMHVDVVSPSLAEDEPVGSVVAMVTGFSSRVESVMFYLASGVSGVYCQEQSYGFGELSYLEFPPPDRSTNLISLEFATVQRNSLLVYCSGGEDHSDFLTVEIVNGTARMTYDLGSGPVRLQTHKQVADGHFHLLSVRRIGSIKEEMLWYTSVNRVSGYKAERVVGSMVADGQWHVLTMWTSRDKSMISVDAEVAVNISESLDLSPYNVESIVLGRGQAELQQTGQLCERFVRVNEIQ